MSSSFTSATSTGAPSVARNGKPYESVLETIGWTPLIHLTRVTRGIRTPVYGKADFFNPGGSVKDRIGLPIIEQAEREGRLKPGGTIVEGTSGNTGVGLAIAAALKSYTVLPWQFSRAGYCRGSSGFQDLRSPALPRRPLESLAQ